MEQVGLSTGNRLAVILVLLLGAVTCLPVQAEEDWNTGWSVHIDNDLFALSNSDQQYTGGASVELAGRRARDWSLSLNPALEWVDELTGFDALVDAESRRMSHSMIMGVSAFTPENISDPQPIQDDHPYGSLVLFGNTRQAIDPFAQTTYKSTLLIGLLGTNIAHEMQDFFHDLTDTEQAQGWDNQISDGGEPTFRYEVKRHELLDSGKLGDNARYDLRWSTGGSVGYVTEATLGASARWGRIGAQWWRFEPSPGEYMRYGAPQRVTDSNEVDSEWYFWFSVEGNLRLYNALLEGQFRDSPVTFTRGELRKFLLESTAGFTFDVPGTGFRAEISLSYRSGEIEDAEGDNPLWGRVSLSRSF